MRALKKHQVLPGQLIVLLHQLEPVGREFLQDLLFAHLVQELDRYRGVFHAELGQRDQSVGFETLAHGQQHLLRIGELVVDVHEQDQVNLALGQLGVAGDSQDRCNVVDTRLLGPLLQQGNHLGLDVDSQHAAAFAHKLGESQGVETIAAAQVADRLAGLDVQRL